MRLEGKRALVTGAQQGIGRAAVLALAREGADVAINWLEGQPAAQQLAEEVRALGRRALTVKGDVSKSADVTRFVDETYRGLGGVDILINNAGVFPRSPFLELTEAEWDRVLDVNLKGSFLVAQAVARKMVADGTKGAIVNISSSSVRGHVLGVHYSASKNGIIGITRSMALALAPHGIRVNAIAPGITLPIARYNLETARVGCVFLIAEQLHESPATTDGAIIFCGLEVGVDKLVSSLRRFSGEGH